MRAFIQPSHESDLGGGGGGVTSAIGSPLRVTMIDFPVFLTLSNKRKHLALNFEMGIVSCTSVLHTLHLKFSLSCTIVNDHGQLEWLLFNKITCPSIVTFELLTLNLEPLRLGYISIPATSSGRMAIT